MSWKPVCSTGINMTNPRSSENGPETLIFREYQKVEWTSLLRCQGTSSNPVLRLALPFLQLINYLGTQVQTLIYRSKYGCLYTLSSIVTSYLHFSLLCHTGKTKVQCRTFQGVLPARNAPRQWHALRARFASVSGITHPPRDPRQRTLKLLTATHACLQAGLQACGCGS